MIFGNWSRTMAGDDPREDGRMERVAGTETGKRKPRRKAEPVSSRFTISVTSSVGIVMDVAIDIRATKRDTKVALRNLASEAAAWSEDVRKRALADLLGPSAAAAKGEVTQAISRLLDAMMESRLAFLRERSASRPKPVMRIIGGREAMSAG